MEQQKKQVSIKCQAMLEMDVMQWDEGIQLEVFEELDVDTTKVLHHFFDRLTDMERLFVLLF